MTSSTDMIVVEIANSYRNMSLIELLAEENMMMTFYHKKGSNSIFKKLQQILCSEIETKLK